MTTRYSYPINLHKEREGGYSVTFPDFDEAFTDADTLSEAVAEAADCLEEALAGRIMRREDIPTPSPANGRPTAVPGTVLVAKTALYEALRERRLSKSAFAVAMGIQESEVRRMLDPRHATKIGRLEKALAHFDKRLVVTVEDVLDHRLAPAERRNNPMQIDYLKEFPIPESQLPPRLHRLLGSVSDDPRLRVEVATRYDFDHHGPAREYEHMVLALAADANFRQVPDETSNGVVCFSIPDVREQGGLDEFQPTVSGLDYIVASWGSGSFYSYNLSEKVWMALGLSPRCLGGDVQRIVYDDLSLPEFGVVEGETTTEYFFSPKRNVRWVMSNEYLRRYLWMRGTYGIRVFYYETLMPDEPEMRTLMDGEAHVKLGTDQDWYKIIILEHQGKLLVRVWGAVMAIPPELCPERSANGLMWPDTEQPMSHDRADALTRTLPVYLDDQFLERYEQSSLFNTVPARVHNQWLCSPSYLGQWSFTDCRRVGRNMIVVPMRELYQPKPDREIVHAYDNVLDSARVAEFNQDEEHIVAKTQRLLDQLLELGDHLETLGAATGEFMPADEIVGFSRAEINANGWSNYPNLCRLAQVAPLNMTEQAFLARCKGIHELWQRIPNGFLRRLVMQAGHAKTDVRDFGSLKLLQALLNIVERLNADGEVVEAFGSSASPDDLTGQNSALTALFANNELRIADAHITGDVLKCLATLGFDIASVNQGYGRALDHVLDGVIQGFADLNKELDMLLGHRRYTKTD